MLKQLTLKNLYNFKEEITFDFDTKKRDYVLAHKFNDDYIGNFSLVYGKNNVGKSNLFRIIKEVKDLLLNGNMNLESYKPLLTKEPSLFEVVFEKEYEEIRYGFEFLIEDGVILDEWLEAKLKSPNKDQLSSRETLFFSRQDEKFHPSFLATDRKSLKDIKSSHLYINYFNSVNHDHEIIHSLINHIQSLKFIDSRDLNGENDNKILWSLLEDDHYVKLFNEFLNAADLDIKEIVVQELSQNELKFLEKMKAVYTESKTEHEREILIRQVLIEFDDILPSIVQKNIIGRYLETSHTQGLSIEFKHRSDATFEYHDLSSGTKQMTHIFTIFVASLHDSMIFLVDEIESGLHLDLIDLTINVFKESIYLQNTNQFIISTHREELLDYPFISKDNMMFLKYDQDLKSPYVECLSEYRTRKEHRLSLRYKLNAFESNPNTSKAYNIKTMMNEMYIHEENTASKKKKV